MKKISTTKLIELIFDISYLITVLILGCLLVASKGSIVKLHFGVMAFILVLGDSFHLLPRIFFILKGESDRINKALHLGKIITSITMTVFYVLLWQICIMLSSNTRFALTIVVLILAIIRILLCLSHRNKWLDKNPPIKWAFYRNLPFEFLGLIVFSGFLINGRYLMSIGIFLSFAFYIPVVLFSQKYPKIGMLMLPKSIVYVFIISCGFFI